MKKAKKLHVNITDPIAIIVAPLTFLLFVIWTLYFFTKIPIREIVIYAMKILF